MKNLRESFAAAELDAPYFPELNIAGYATDGLPITGTPSAYLTRQQAENLPTAAIYGIGTFETWNDDHMVKYRQIMDRIANGTIIERFRDTMTCLEHKGWIILLEWIAQHHPADSMTPGAAYVDPRATHSSY